MLKFSKGNQFFSVIDQIDFWKEPKNWSSTSQVNVFHKFADLIFFCIVRGKCAEFINSTLMQKHDIKFVKTDKEADKVTAIDFIISFDNQSFFGQQVKSWGVCCK